MAFTTRQAASEQKSAKEAATKPSAQLFNDQRASTGVQLKQQQLMQSAQTPTQLMAEEEEPVQGKFATAQLAGMEEEEPVQGKFTTAQLAGMEEEEPVQGKFETLQRAGAEEEEAVQAKFNSVVTAQLEQKPNNTGMPDTLKSGIESLSGYSMDDVKVHYNSDKPAQLNAHAYAQGTDIHVAPGQEQHLPHEAWHVVQQKQGRVQPTVQMKAGVPVNDDAGLENEADVMGAKAVAVAQTKQMDNVVQEKSAGNVSVQLKSAWKGEGEKYHRVANKDVVRVVKELDKPKNNAAITGSPESKGGVWYPDVEESTAAGANINIVLMHDSDPGAKITPYSKNGYAKDPAPRKSDFGQEPHYHKGTLKASRVRAIAANTGAARDFSDKPVTYTDSNHDYVDANAEATTTFESF